MIISSKLFDAYLKCPTKCYLKARGEIGVGNDYVEWVKNQEETFQQSKREDNGGVEKVSLESEDMI